MDLWKYCTPQHCKDMLLSFRLLQEYDWPEQKKLACLYALSNHTEQHYEQIRIPKKHGGTRKLFVPDALLCIVQKNILHHILDGMKPGEAATAYHKGASVVLNASMHTGKKLVLKLDIKDFFGSITFPMVLRHAFPGQYFPPSVGVLLTSLCCCGEYLPQGAPTSPAISNLVFRPFDYYMKGWCQEREITYSRYCDDMTFSGDFDPSVVKNKVYGYLRAMGFLPNQKKMQVLTQGNRQLVTGIVVNECARVPRKYKRELRQEIYYCQKFGVEGHLSQSGDRRFLPDGETGMRRYLMSLLGKVDFVLALQPEEHWFQEAKMELKAALMGVPTGIWSQCTKIPGE